MKCSANKSSRPSRTLATVLGACVLAFASPTFAANWAESTISTVYPYEGGLSYVLQFDNPPADCQDPNGYFRIKVGGVFGTTQQGVNNLFSLALLAASTDTIISFYYDPATCEISRFKAGF